MRLFAVIAAVALTLAAATPASRAVAAHSSGGLAKSSSGTTDTLYSGQQLVNRRDGFDSLRSRSGEYWLYVSSGSLNLDQIARMTGPRGDDTVETGVWHEEDTFGPPVADHDRTTLRLRRTGNLVLLTQRGRVLWSTHTAGTGSHNRLVVRDTGNLVLYDGAGKRLWSSRTTPVMLGAGESLPSGHRMVNRWDHNFIGFKLLTLTMQRDGNLVYRCRNTVNWSSHTHVRGSRLVMQDNGNAVIRAPDGRRVWSTHTRGTPYAVFEMLGVQSFGGTSRWVWAPRLSDPLHC